MAVSGIVLSDTALAQDLPAAVATGDTDLGTVLTNQDGMTLYTFDEDPRGGSSCYGRCAENWPPLVASPDAAPVGDFSIVKREDSVAQWAYQSKPLYLWVRDKAAGDTTGDGVRGWHAARP